ncbi:hypothetical protein [Ochrobactrum chromiisoli]|uniref:Uncharacterized protein n=1 Tax=Ochrobactrum chromiisoli TaxID=2993941 RepID=A0ABT3QKW1_9HYPH|nr:hypothetical protein [Ochrobactrum chromiisoli]MCX2696243.1 hypothetical protein [Ochrobactrum chromiisoli]
MTIQSINIGSGPNSVDAESTRDGFAKVNSNFASVDSRIQKLERLTHPFGSYEDPGLPPFPAFTYASKDWEKYTSVTRHHETENLTSLTMSNTAKIVAMSATRFMLVSKSSTILTIKIFELASGVLSRVAQTNITVLTGAQVLGIAVVSEDFAKISLQNGSSIGALTQNFVEVYYATGSVNATLIAATAPIAFSGQGSVYPSNNSRAPLLASTSAMSIYIAASSSNPVDISGLWIQRFSTGQSQNSHLETSLAMSAENRVSPSYDYLGGEKYIVASAGAVLGDHTARLTISVLSANDNATKLLGNTSFMGSSPDGGVSVFALSPALAIISWSSSGIQKAISVAIDSSGQPMILGAASSAGALGSAITSGTPYDQTSLVAGSWPVDTDPGKLVKLDVDTDTGVISEANHIAYSLSWAAARGKWLDMIRLSADRVLVAIQPTVTPFGVALDIIDLDVA